MSHGPESLEARTRFLEFEKRGKAPCAGGVAGPMGGNISRRGALTSVLCTRNT